MAASLCSVYRRLCSKLSKQLPAQNLFHKTHTPKFALDIRWGTPELKHGVAGPLLERFIGVIVRCLLLLSSSNALWALSRDL